MTDLRWDEWLLRTHKEIEAAGHNPRERFDRIGHRRPLSRRWAKTIGMWGLKSPLEIMTAVGVDPDSSSRGTFDVFKHRHQLYASAQFARYMAKLPPGERTVYEIWTQAELAATVHGHARFLMQDGTARRFDGAVIDAVRRRFHILPIEAYLYYTTVEDLLAEKMIPRESWYELSYLERRSMWNNAWGPKISARVGPPELLSSDEDGDDQEVHGDESATA